MQFIVVIPARFASSRLPGKAIARYQGYPYDSACMAAGL
jgi:CMP-2-keto-3-deoxyoctulosonic acid synthetase